MQSRFTSVDRPRLFALLGLGFAIVLSLAPEGLEGQEIKRAVRLARLFLESDEEERRDELAESLADYDDRIDDVVAEYRLPKRGVACEPGTLLKGRFSACELRKKHKEDLLYFIVPSNYRPESARGLIVFLHGGGATSKRSWPEYYLKEGREDESYVGDVLRESGMIVVGASAPKDDDWARWCLDEATEYVADVILECKHRFRIDDDRVFLLGHSMGGCGAYHHALIQPDRFAGIAACSGAWMKAYWPASRGTPLFIIHGVNDAKLGERGHFTDILFARETRKIFSKERLTLHYLEHQGGHDLADSKELLRVFLDKAADLKRDPYYPHIGIASRNGFHGSRNYSHKVRHNRWLTLDEPTDGEISFSRLKSNATMDSDDTTSENPAFDKWKLRSFSASEEGCLLDARIVGANLIHLQAKHVQKFTIWLHPKMVDLSKPVKVVVNGEVEFAKAVKPSLRTALESYERKQDWGLVYHARITIDVDTD